MGWKGRIASWGRHEDRSDTGEPRSLEPEPERAPRATGTHPSRAVVDNAVYCDGERVEPASLEQTYELIRERRGLGWIGLYRPEPEDVEAIAEEFGLHPLAVEDALHAHQRPKLERYGDTLFVVLHPARYVDSEEVVEIGELHLFIGPDFVVSIRHSESPDMRSVRRRMEEHPELLRLGPEAVLYAILDRIVDDYAPVLRGVATDIDQIETQVFNGDAEVSHRIYQLGREVIEFRHATQPLGEVFQMLRSGFEKYHVDIELQRLLRDVEDHTVRITERIDSFRELLNNMLSANATVVAQRQNEEMRRMTETSLAQNEEIKRISSWAAILFAPTLVGTVYGMNFDHMPELHWLLGYPFAIVLMGMVSVTLYFVFKAKDWL
ncbi:magnesium and cobalt transport protein CorA [Glycomyces algeriensis]|uniref:Magnesium transporter CorA n=1 Tax=Glycomyces algeriensis TaxID=256037 RepID=A0A9W6LGX2_9ACTN|nr:magnesium and cobalt transport protein CorA [Glycomyces algeriensis]MDA1364310.1 magnesium and cobalt transport protein CorA [Glycomyces algeriensis]MDR7350342.1 magnesium transporter [Glycomyces algeriensis]GLI43048.1 magnesium transporter CorA [Glycomyces algeriensis]